jgi:hypothetical protein
VVGAVGGPELALVAGLVIVGLLAEDESLNGDENLWRGGDKGRA